MMPASVTKALRVMPDGREICNTTGKRRTKEGVEEYKRRLDAMVKRQKGICCLCGYSDFCGPNGSLFRCIPTFEHENGRSAGKRDDRIELPDGTWINGAAHLQCNNWKGSRKIPYNAGKRSSDASKP